LEELKNALIRFQIALTDKEIKMFLQRLDEDRKGYITEQQFIKKFWAAYTYDDVF
jgi:Ca2+-binding EF-hand superfamily protein